jgi:uncharacterized glyoxalase superfamily protein PhnB
MSEGFWTRPILRVRDAEASLAYWRDRLGFEEIWRHGEGRVLLAEVGRDGFHVILDSGSVLPRPAGPSAVSLSLHRADGLDALHRELVERGALVAMPPFAVAWQQGVMELDVRDPDGNTLVFWGDAPAEPAPASQEPGTLG